MAIKAAKQSEINLGSTLNIVTTKGPTTAAVVDNIPPTVELTSNKDTLIAGESATIKFIFSEKIKGFTVADIDISGGILSNFSGSGQTRSVIFTPDADTNKLTNTIAIIPNSYTDKAGNSGSAGNTLTLTSDTAAPGLTISSDKTSLKAGETRLLTFTFSEAIQGFDANDITISGGTLGALSDTGLVRTAIFTPTADTNKLSAAISVIEGRYTDTLGNSGTASNILTLAGDTAAPSLIISSDNKASLSAGESATLSFTFSETVKNFKASDITVTGGTLGELSGIGLTRTATFTQALDATLPGTISVAGGSYTDKAGNNGTGNALTLLGDTVAPTLNISSDKAALKAGETATLTFSFSETPKGFSAADINISGGTLGAFSFSGTGLTRTATFIPTADINDLTSVIRVAAGSYTDAAGNKGTASNTLSLSGDTLAPSLTISSGQTDFKSGETSTVTFSFNEAPTGFSVGDVSVTGGHLSDLAVNPNDSKVYTALFTPTPNIKNLTGSIDVAANSYTDAAGNNGNASNTIALTGNTNAPSVIISSDPTALKAGETATITFTFSEKIKGFAVGDIAVTSGSLSGLAVDPNDSTVYTALFTPTANTNNLTGSISVAKDSYTDTAGNKGTASNTLALTGDTLAPNLTISSGQTDFKSGETAAVTFNFNEAPTGFSAGDVSVTGGHLSDLAVNPNDSKVYTALFTPTPNIKNLTGSIDVAANSYTDAAGNNGSASNTIALTGNTNAPSVIVSSDHSVLKAGETATISFAFSEKIKGFAPNDIAVTGGSLSGLAVNPNDSTVYTARFTPTVNTNNLVGSISVAKDSYTDTIGNTGTAGELALTGDTAAPTLAISSDKASLIAGETATLTFTFSEEVKSFTASDIIVTGWGGLGVLSGTGLTRSATFTQALDSTLPSSISVAADSYTDIAGNKGDASNKLTLSGDTLAPTLAISSDQTTFKASETATITFAFNEAVKNFTADDITVSGGTLGTLSGTGLTRTATFTPTADINNLTGKISVAADSYTDTANNKGTASNTLALTGDTQAPTLLITSGITALKAGETAGIEFDFSEAPTGFTASDIVVTGGTLTAPTVSALNTHYTAFFTPTPNTASGNASITVAAGAYTDTAGNKGGAGTTPTISIDTLAPTLAISSTQTAFKAGETATVSFAFNEAVKDFAVSDLTATGGSLSGLAANPSDNKLYTALFTPTVNSNSLTGAISVAAGSYTDNAGNKGTASNALTLTGDTQSPSVAVSSDKDSFKIGETATVTFAFNEVPTGFTASDVSVTGGSLGNLTAGADGKTYTALFTPTVNTNSLTGAISVAADSYTDTVGNKGTASNTLALTGDTQAPSLAISPTKVNFKAGDTAALTFNFSEAPTGFDATDITVTGGSVSGLAVNPSNNKLYTASFTPSANTNTLTGAISVAAGSYTDALGNKGLVSNIINLTGDILAPSVAITSSKTSFKAGDTSTVTLTFSETPSSFSSAAVTVTGGSLGSATVDPTNNKVYTALFTPSANDSLNGAISLAAKSYLDAAGNEGTASNTLTLTGDTLAPSVAVSSSKTSFKAGDTATVTFTFNEAPTGFAAADVTATGGSLGSLVVSPSDSKVYTALFTPTVNTNSLSGAISVAADSYTDTVGNKGALSNNLVLTGDTLAPTLAISSDKSSLLAGDTAVLTFTFSEAPTGFELGDVAVTGGSLGALSGSGLARTATFTPTDNASGTASISVASDSYTDAAGNAGGAGNTSLNFNTVINNTSPPPPTDTTPPSAPTIISVTDDVAPVTGTVVNHGHTNDRVLVLAGSAEANSTVKVYNDTSLLGATTTNGAGQWSYTTGTLDTGATYAFKAKATDVANNTSTASASYTVTLETPLSGGSIAAPAQYNADNKIAAYLADFSNHHNPGFAAVSHFGADDVLVLNGVTAAQLSVANHGADVLITANLGLGEAAQITLVGVTTASQIVYGIDGFNTLPIGDITLI